jgi:glycosyltransferase involved in cell wall biosynthesis
MPLYYNASDVMVSLSSNDSLPNCMLESMACGLPVIMGDIPQTREWVEGEFRVPPRNADILAERITDLLAKSPEEIRTIGVKHLSMMKNHFGNEQNIERIKQLVHQVAHK